jgi:hypothetical protein
MTIGVIGTRSVKSLLVRLNFCLDVIKQVVPWSVGVCSTTTHYSYPTALLPACQGTGFGGATVSRYLRHQWFFSGACWY